MGDRQLSDQGGETRGICRSLRFTLVEEREVTFADRVIRTNHWAIDPAGTWPGSPIP
jgi:hypothetical protein